MSLTLNNVIIESREDGFINATQLCKAGGKVFKDWYRLNSTKELIEELEETLNGQIRPFKNLVEVKKGRYNSGSWIHPDLAVQLAQWISPSFAIQVSRWIRELLVTGNVSVNSKKSDEELIELQNQVKQLQLENKEKDDTLNRLHNIQKELLSYKKHVTKEETIYIVSTADYARQGIFKISRTKNKMNFRSSSHNTTHIAGDKVKVIKTFKVNDSVLVERNIHMKLSGLLVEGEREFFICPYDLLENIVDVIIHHDDEENDIVNKIVDTVYKLRQVAFESKDWIQGIPENIFKETLTIAAGDEKLAELDVSKWDEQRKQEFVGFCIKEYIKENNSLNEEDFQIMWKTFQTFLVAQLPIVKSKFKATEWKAFVKEEAEKEKLQIKWRS
jgi:hypothetical protein